LANGSDRASLDFAATHDYVHNVGAIGVAATGVRACYVYTQLQVVHTF
jgi:hypothetical protein